MSARRMKAEGQAKRIKGKIKEVTGRLTGDDRLTASGRADVAEGKAQAGLGQVGEKVERIARKVRG